VFLICTPTEDVDMEEPLDFRSGKGCNPMMSSILDEFSKLKMLVFADT
jgi:hypothetical protein